MEHTNQPTEQNPAPPPQRKWLMGIVVALAAVASCYLIYTFTASGEAPPSAPPGEPAREQLPEETAAPAKPADVYQGPAALHFNHRQNAYTAFVFNTTKHDIEFYYQNDKGEKYLALSKARAAAAERGDSLLFATNAGIFDPEYRPVGLFVSDGKELAPLNTDDGAGNFFLKPNGVFFMQRDGALGILEAEEFQDKSPPVAYATQSGPLLLRRNEVHPAFNEGSPNRLVRSGVGLISPNEAVFLISDGPVNFYDFSMAFREQFKCRDALYLDGVISQAYLPGLNRSEQDGQSFAGMIGITRK